MKHPQFSCSVSDESTALPHFWEHTVGSGHAPLALRADWRTQCAQCAGSSAFVMSAFTAVMR